MKALDIKLHCQNSNAEGIYLLLWLQVIPISLVLSYMRNAHAMPKGFLV